METKICCRCGLEKELNDFPKEKDNLNKRDKLDWELK